MRSWVIGISVRVVGKRKSVKLPTWDCKGKVRVV